jgi:single-strand DNA-binding protein
MLAKLTIIGNLGSDPEMKYTPDGTPVTNFSVAANRSYKNTAGETVVETTWFKCAAWRKLAEVVNQYLSKGRQVYVEGRLRPEIRVWEGSDGTPHASYEVTVETIKFLGGPRGESASAEEAPAPEAPAGDEIPF